MVGKMGGVKAAGEAEGGGERGSVGFLSSSSWSMSSWEKDSFGVIDYSNLL
jgi:hypothetical protein